MKDLTTYATYIFDCDGVILNSNKVKTETFRDVTLPFGDQASSRFVQYHEQNGGVSRYVKFEYFIDHILPNYSPHPIPQSKSAFLQTLLDNYAASVKEQLMSCDVASNLNSLRNKTRSSKWLIVSGSDENELRYIFENRGLSKLFDGGIYGSPDSKYEIISRELGANRISQPALFFGDSKFDHEVARYYKLDFVFVSQWSEFKDWAEYCKTNKISVIPYVELLATLS